MTTFEEKVNAYRESKRFPSPCGDKLQYVDEVLPGDTFKFPSPCGV